jgi:hypothetical protein
VITWVADPVLKLSGRPPPAAVDEPCPTGVDVDVGVAAEVVGRLVVGIAADVDGLATGVVGLELELDCPDDVLELGVPAVPDVQATTRAATARQDPKTAALPERRLTPPECHAMPIKIRGWVPGVRNQCIRVTRLPCGIATQPAVGWPSVTCRKNAEPFG